jgi:hypothetical protein
MEKLKKILMIISLSGVGIAAVMLILQVLGVNIFNGFMLRVLLVVATIAVASGISISEIAVIKRKRILGYVGLGLLSLSTLFALIIFCSNILITDSIFNRITGITAITSVLFIIIISLYSKLGKSYIAMQIPTYISLVAIDIILSLLIAGVNVFKVGGMLSIFIILCIIAGALLIATSVISSKIKSSEVAPKVKNDMVLVPREEYENLKKENDSLKAELEKLRKNSDD